VGGVEISVREMLRIPARSIHGMVGSSASDAAKTLTLRAPRCAVSSRTARRWRRRRRPELAVGKSDPIARAGNEFDSKLAAGGPDELGVGPKTRFAMVGFVGADDRLRDASAPSEIGLRQACSSTSFAQHWDDGRACGWLLVWPGLRLGLGAGPRAGGAHGFICVWCQDLDRPPAAGPAGGCGGTSRSRIALDQEHRDAPRPCLLLETDSIPMERTWSDGP
jgi:hypothetical protein